MTDNWQRSTFYIPYCLSWRPISSQIMDFGTVTANGLKAFIIWYMILKVTASWYWKRPTMGDNQPSL